VVFEDSNGNGLQDSGESGLPDVLIELSAGGGPLPSATGTTDPSGGYSFTVTSLDTYTVRETDPDGYQSTTPNTVHVRVVAFASYTVDFGDEVIPPSPTATETPTVTPTPTPRFGFACSDINGDGFVDQRDLDLFFQDWHRAVDLAPTPTPLHPCSDINGDGRVNDEDLAWLMWDWYRPVGAVPTSTPPPQ